MDRVRTITGPAARRAAIAATGAGEVTVAGAATVVVRVDPAVRKTRVPILARGIHYGAPGPGDTSNSENGP
jgi:hypothetical protein